MPSPCPPPPGAAAGPQPATCAASRSPARQPSQGSGHRPLGPTFRANPFPEVTDLFCRLPLPTLFYRLEAVHLRDLMRIVVRLGVQINHSFAFSRTVEEAPDISNMKYFPSQETLSPVNLIPG